MTAREKGHVAIVVLLGKLASAMTDSPAGTSTPIMKISNLYNMVLKHIITFDKAGMRVK